MIKANQNPPDSADKPTVLIVDDDPDDRDITLLALRRARFAVRCVQAESGEAALAFLHSSEQLPAVTLMDLKMPGMSGIDTLRRIRADARLCEIPVVIMTNSSLASDRAAAIAAGADDFLQKEFDLTRYGSAVGEQLERWAK